MRTRHTNRAAVLVLAGMTVGIVGCKGGTPPVIADIGNAVDRGTRNVVESARNAVAPRNLPPPQDGEEEAVTRAREAYEAGRLAYQTADYIVAVEKFTESFAAADEIEDAELRAQVQSSLYYNLGAAQLYAYDLDQDRTRLGKSKALLQKYLDAYPDVSDEERQQIDALMAEADAKLAEADANADALAPEE